MRSRSKSISGSWSSRFGSAGGSAWALRACSSASFHGAVTFKYGEPVADSGEDGAVGVVLGFQGGATDPAVRALVADSFARLAQPRDVRLRPRRAMFAKRYEHFVGKYAWLTDP